MLKFQSTDAEIICLYENDREKLALHGIFAALTILTSMIYGNKEKEERIARRRHRDDGHDNCHRA